MNLDQLVSRLAPKFAAEFLKRPARPCRIFLSASDMKTRAVIRHAADIDPTAAFNAALAQLRSVLGSRNPIILRADWITDVESMTWSEFNNLIGSTKRNEFNRGIAFSPDFSIALTASELNANLILYSVDNPNGVFNVAAASSYIRARFDRDLPKLEPSSPIAVFDTAGVFVLGGNKPQSIDAAGHRIVTTPDAKLTRQIIQSAVQYLDAQLLNSGRFVHGRRPCTDRFVPSYDATHHFTAVLALLAAYDADGRKDDHLRNSIERAIKYGVETYAELLSDEKYAPLKVAFDRFLSDQTVPDVKELLPIVGADDPEAATEARAKALLDKYFWTETAMFFARPEIIFGSFFARSDAFRVRIDDVARPLTSLVEWSKHAPEVEDADVDELESERAAWEIIESTSKPKVDQIIQKMVELIGVGGSATPRGEAKIFFGGNMIIGRQMHLLASDMKHLEDIPAMRAADVRVVNLLGAASAHGEPVNKKYAYYMHARPEQINILTECAVDVALTANHHTGDYGAAAVLDQNKLLDEAGIGRVGSGANFDEASTPIYVKANDLTVAIFSVDATTEEFAADDNRAGTFYIPIDDPDAWFSIFDEKIAEARRHADAVFVAIDWESVGSTRSLEQRRAVGRALIDSGADGVLGCDSFWFNRVEKYKERPIIYGAGLFVLDGGDGDAGAYSLTLDTDGVKTLKFNALRRSNGKVRPADKERDRINDDFMTRCRELRTDATVGADGAIEVTFKPAPRGAIERSAPPTIFDPSTVERHEIKPLTEPLPEWTVERVPDEARIEPMQFGALKLIGYGVEPTVLTEYGPFFVETYWTIDEPIKNECRFYIEGKSTRENDMPFFGAEHEFEDWQFPVARWKPGVIYKERFGMRPPLRHRIANVDLRVEIRVRLDGRWIGPFIGPKLIEMRLPDVPWYRRDFPDVINQSEPGHCWTAKQLAAVTGGRWLIEPPSGWYVQSILRDIRFCNRVESPIMFVASQRSKYLFHADNASTPGAFFYDNRFVYDNHFMVAKYADKIAGAIIDHEDESLPKDLPLLLVEDSVKASIEIGLAARRRFKGKTIAVSGDLGKTTTINLLEHVLSEAGEVVVPYGSENTPVSAPTTFANVKADAAYAIVELSKDVIGARRGSVTYDLMPDVVVVTSNFGFDKDSAAAARMKARVFCGAVEGGFAILNRDMKHYDIFEAAAKRHGLNVITFGRHADSTVRMPELKRGGSVFVSGAEYKLDVALSSDQLYDALAVLAVTSALSHGGGGPSGIIDRLKAFEPPIEPPIFKLENTSGRKIAIGTFRLHNPDYKAVACAIYAKSIDCDFFMFYPEDVDPINKKINAHVYKDGQWIDEIRDYPDVVIDVMNEFILSELGKHMLPKIPNVYIDIFSKARQYAWLEADPLLRKYVIPYAPVNNRRDVMNFIDRIAAPIILKPLGSSLGQGVTKVLRLPDGNYEITEDHDSKVVTPQEFDTRLKNMLTRSYVAQRYVKSCMTSGMPFDMRVHVRRNGTTQWNVVKIYTRAGLAKSLTSNLAGGGAMAEGQAFLRSHLGRELGDRTYHQLEELGKILPARLQHTRIAHNIDALGIDVGIEADGSMFIFEMNTSPSVQYLYLEAAVCSVDYAKTLALNPDMAFPEL